MRTINSSGLYELNADGVVLYSSLKSEDGSIKRFYDLDGQHFFKKVVPASNVSDFRFRFEMFRESNIPSEAFDFTYQNNSEHSTCRVLLARVPKGEETPLYLVYIRPDF